MDEEDILGFEFEDEDDAPEDHISGSVVRADRFGIETFTEEKKLITWLNRVRRLPLEAIDDAIVKKTYAAAVWLFRASAVSGNLNQTKAMKMWLDWAQPIINKNARDQKKPPKSPGSKVFLPREPGAKDI